MTDQDHRHTAPKRPENPSGRNYADEERVHPFPHPGAARDAQLERGPAQHLVFVAGEQDIELASKVD